jgi:FMNH2-dependent dimethyl sulfone monooxygenase
MMYSTIPVGQSRLLSSPNSFKLLVFGSNSQAGTTITGAPGTVYPTWDEQVTIAQLAESANFEALLSGARWMGYGGKTNYQGRTLETFPWAAGLAALTSRIQIFATYHVPTAHPVRIAKTVATIDQIARGRFGLNVVAGWNAHEIELFGSAQREHDLRYEYAADFLDVVNRLLASDGRTFDIDNDHFHIKGAYSEPGPVQTPRPVYMAAGLSPTGRDFAARYADVSFIPGEDPEKAAPIVADTRRRAAGYGREILAFGHSTIVCADTEKEAQDYYRYFVDEMGDFEAARNLMSTLFGATLDESGQARTFEPPRAMMRNFIGGNAIIGTPEQIVEAFLARSRAGLDGCAVSWVNYADGLAQFREQILPLMIQAGLRVEEDEPAAAVLPGTSGSGVAV